MSFLGNNAVNRVNLHYGVTSLAKAGGGVFLLVFLVRQGISIPAALIAVAVILAGRFILRPVVLPLAIRVGLKPLIIVGSLGVAIQFVVLGQVRGLDAALIAFIVITALAEILYWPSYNAYFAAVGDSEHRGKQVAVRVVLNSGAAIVAPLAGAWAMITVGPAWMFAGVGLIQALSVLPLLGAPNVRIAARAPGGFKAGMLGGALQAADGWFDGWYGFVWQLVLFGALGESVAGYGGAVALAALASALCGLVLGRYIDLGHGWKVVVLTCVVGTIGVTLSAASAGNPVLAVVANMLIPVVNALQITAFTTASYNLSKASPCPMRFAMMTEAGWDVATAAACLTAAGLVTLGVPLSLTIPLALPAIIVPAVLLRRHYTKA
jgi:MFS family permease